MLFGYSLSLCQNTEPKRKQNSIWKWTLQQCIMGCLWIVANKFYATFGSQHFVDIHGNAVVRHQTRDRKVAGSTPGRGTIKSTRSPPPSIPPGSVNRVPACMAGVRRDAFTCVEWQVTLCDTLPLRALYHRRSHVEMAIVDNVPTSSHTSQTCSVQFQLEWHNVRPST